jgi:hypothetical protein
LIYTANILAVKFIVNTKNTLLGGVVSDPAKLENAPARRGVTAAPIIKKGDRDLQPDRHEKSRKRVVSAAEAALAHKQYVSAIDVLTGSGMLAPTHVESWRRGRIDFLERTMQGNLGKISESMAMFRAWALKKGLKASETGYVRRARNGTVDLRFSKSGDPGIEKNYRTHYVSPALSERKQERLTQKLSTPAKPVVFEILRDSACSECGAELPQGSFLIMEAEQSLCLPCARLDDLEYLPAGDAALTRRAARYSERSAVVVRFSRSRGHYERQGVLVEKSGLEKAEQECSEDAGARAKARAAGAARRLEHDRELVARMAAEIGKLFPGCPLAEAAAIAAHTATRNSGRVGRTLAGRNLDEGALTAAVTAAVRHRRTEYDAMLAAGMDRVRAREEIADRVQMILADWR